MINVLKCKCIEKGGVKTAMSFDHYKNVLQNSLQMVHNMKTIGSKNRKIKSYVITKNSLSCFDNKRYICIFIIFFFIFYIFSEFFLFRIIFKIIIFYYYQ